MNNSLLGIRKSFGWSQADLAHRIGVSLSTLVRWEMGRTMRNRSQSRKRPLTAIASHSPAGQCMSVLWEGRVIRNWIVQIQSAEPAIGEVQMDLLAKPPP